jgi:hypothetical protein
MTTTTERQPINRKNFTEAIRAAVEERGADWRRLSLLPH